MTMMDWKCLLLAVFFVLLSVHQGVSDFVSDEERLRTDLLTNYTTTVRPAYKTYIYVSTFLSSLNHLNIASQSMSVNMILFAVWQDSRLMWNNSSYGGLDTLVTAPEAVWTPPLVIENSVDDVGVIGGKNRDATPVRISNTGMVTWSPPTEVTTSCEMIIAQYPFDTQTCTIVLIGWTYPLSEMGVSVGAMDTTMFSPNGEFDLKETKTYHTDLGGPAESQTYRKLVFEFTFRRKWQFYGQNLLMPIVLNSILMTAVFALPIDSGEKMGYCLTVLLSYVVFLTWVTENLPPVSTDTSILQVYLAVVLCMGCLASLFTTWVLYLYHKSYEDPVTGFYHAFAKRVLLPLQDLRCCRKKQAEEDTGDDESEIPRSKRKIAPLDPLPLTGHLARRRRRMRRNCGALGVIQVADNVAEKDPTAAGFGDGREETLELEFTWQEIAVLMDYFFFWVFTVALLIVTIVIMSLLYAKY